MIKVQFKNNYENNYMGKEYTYKDYSNAEVGDIVVANTQSGYAVARVSQVNIIDTNIDLNRLNTIEKVIVTKKEIDEKAKQEYDKKLKINQFVVEAKRKCLLGYLSDFTTDENLLKDLTSFSTEELETISKLLAK